MKQPDTQPRRYGILRTLLGVFFLLLLIVFLLPLGSGVVNIGVVVPAAAAVLGLLACVCFERLRGILTYIGKRKGLRIAMGILLGIVGVLLILFLAVSGLMLAGAARPAPENATVIVLGAGLHDGKPSRMLADRLNAAARYLDANPESICIVSGGQGADEPWSEAYAMKTYLLEKGVPEERIRVEDESTSTYENVQFSKRIIEEENLSRTVVIATQEFHQFRAQSFAKQAGFTEVGPCTCRTPLHLLLCYWVREFAAICHMALLGR